MNPVSTQALAALEELEAADRARREEQERQRREAEQRRRDQRYREDQTLLRRSVLGDWFADDLIRFTARDDDQLAGADGGKYRVFHYQEGGEVSKPGHGEQHVEHPITLELWFRISDDAGRKPLVEEGTVRKLRAGRKGEWRMNRRIETLVDLGRSVREYQNPAQMVAVETEGDSQ